MLRKTLSPPAMLAAGLILGAASRLLDIYTTNLGNIFSQLAVWILLGVLISIYSDTKLKAALNILPFCLGMLVTYYAAAFLTRGVYSPVFITGWTVFALCSPIFAYFTWMAKEPGLFPKIIGAGIVAASVLSSLVLFDGFRVYDAAITILLVYFLFIKDIKRPAERNKA